MSSKLDVISEIIRLYDENAYLKRELQVAQREKEMYGVDKLAIALGYDAIAKKLVGSWSFGYHAPKVRNDDNTVKPFEEWLASLDERCFEQSDLVELMKGGQVSFEALKSVCRGALRDFYDEKVGGGNEAV